MITSIIPLANWGIGTFMIVVFAIVCIVLTALVLSFIFGGNKKSEENTSEKETLKSENYEN